MKKTNRALFLLLVVGLLAVFPTITVNAQKAVSSDLKSVKITNAEDNAIQSYIKISSLPEDKQRDFFIAASAEQKADLWKVHMALAITKRPNLNKDQRGIITEAASLLTAESFETPAANNSSKMALLQSLSQRARAVFPRADVAEMLFRLGGGANEIKILENFQAVAALSPTLKKETFGTFSHKTQSDVWRLHLALNLLYRSDLNQAQKTIIFDLVEFASPEHYEIVKIESLRKTRLDEPLKVFMQRVAAAFGKSDVEEIFFTLGKATKDDEEMLEDLVNGNYCKCSTLISVCNLVDYTCSGDNCYINPFCGIIYLAICDGVKCVAN